MEMVPRAQTQWHIHRDYNDNFTRREKIKRQQPNKQKLKHMFSNCCCGEIVVDDAQEGWLKN